MKITGVVVCFCLCFLWNGGYCAGLAGGYGLEFEELIPREAYNSQTVETVNGTVKEILKNPKSSGIGNTIILLVSLSTNGDIYAILAPDWFMENQKYPVKVGDALTITGSKIDYEGKKVILAAEVTRGDQVFKLRDKTTGKAAWSEWRRDEEIFYKNYSW